MWGCQLRSIGILLPFLLFGHLSAFTAAHTNVEKPVVAFDRHPKRPHAYSSVLRQRGGQLDLPVSRANSKLSSAVGKDDSFIATPGTAEKFKTFASKNSFLLGMFVSVGLARVFPALGKNGGVLRPELFIGKFGVTLIFLLSGISLELSDLTQAASNFKLNTMVQLVTFGAWPVLGLGLRAVFSTFLPNAFPQALLDGLLILTCLPTTVNMCIFLTSAAGGNVASSLWNAIVSNLGTMLFVFLSLCCWIRTHVRLLLIHTIQLTALLVLNCFYQLESLLRLHYSSNSLALKSSYPFLTWLPSFVARYCFLWQLARR
jgi:hypothetical protein